MEFLQGYSTVKELSKALDLRTDDLDASYLFTMERIASQDRQYSSIAKRAITWILYAKRTLTISELQHALAICDTEYTFDERDIPPEDVVATASCGIIKIQPQSGVVRLVRE